jgi:hypothetical protein
MYSHDGVDLRGEGGCVRKGRRGEERRGEEDRIREVDVFSDKIAKCGVRRRMYTQEIEVEVEVVDFPRRVEKRVNAQVAQDECEVKTRPSVS